MATPGMVAGSTYSLKARLAKVGVISLQLQQQQQQQVPIKPLWCAAHAVRQTQHTEKGHAVSVSQ
jgi:hypothetical protein